jgi:hypothetical protein
MLGGYPGVVSRAAEGFGMATSGKYRRYASFTRTTPGDQVDVMW